MSKVLLFSDIHIDQHKKSLDRLHHCLEAFEWVFQTAQSHSIKDVIFAGDLFQSRQKIDVMTYHLTFKILEKYCSKLVNLWLLLGNHDMWFHDKWDISSVEPFSAIDGITFIDKPCTLDVAGVPVDFLPYTHAPLDHLNVLRKGLKKRKDRKTLIAHLAVDGAQLNTLHNTRSDVIIEHDGEMTRVDSDSFEGWDKVWLGHYHGQQKVGLVAEYIGSPLQLNFGEAFQHKHVIIYNLEDGSTEYIRNKFSPQHFIIPEKDIDKYDVTKNFIRLEVEDVGNADLLQLRKEVQQMKPGSLEIMPVEKKEQTHVVSDAKAILYKEDEMLTTYVDQVLAESGDNIAKLDKETLLKIGKEICQLQTE